MKDSITWTRTGHICVNVTKHSCRSKYVLHRFSVVHNIPSCIQSWYNTDKMHLLEWTVTVTRVRVRVRVVILSLQCWQRAAIFTCYGSLSCGIRDIASSNSFAHRVLTKTPWLRWSEADEDLLAISKRCMCWYGTQYVHSAWSKSTNRKESMM